MNRTVKPLLTRVVEVQEKSSKEPKRLLLQIFEPEKVSAEQYACEVSLEGKPSKQIYGVDGMQAVLLSIQFLEKYLDAVHGPSRIVS